MSSCFIIFIVIVFIICRIILFFIDSFLLNQNKNKEYDVWIMFDNWIKDICIIPIKGFISSIYLWSYVFKTCLTLLRSTDNEINAMYMSYLSKVQVLRMSTYHSDWPWEALSRVGLSSLHTFSVIQHLYSDRWKQDKNR